jgi:hypothetical protein
VRVEGLTQTILKIEISTLFVNITFLCATEEGEENKYYAKCLDGKPSSTILQKM